MPEPAPQDVLDLVERATSFPSEADVHVVVLTQARKSPPELFRLNLSDELAERFSELARKYATVDLAQRVPVPYGPARTPLKNELVFVGSSRTPLIAEIADQMSVPENLPLFDPTMKAASNIRLYFIRVSWPEAQAALNFFSALSPRARLARSRRIAAALSKGSYDVLRQEVMIFDSRLDGSWSEDLVVTTAQGTIESVLGLLAEIAAVAGTTFASVTGSLGIDNLEALRSAATSELSMMRKLRSIADKIADSPDYLEAMTMPRLLAFIDSHPAIEVDLEGDGTARRLVFHNDITAPMENPPLTG